jgi:inner membrane protein
MDNLTHTLAGFAFAESGLKRRTRLGTAALVLGANLPDLDGLSYLFGSGIDGLAFRRGWTHGVLAMAVLPLLLAAALLGWSRLVPREGHATQTKGLLLLAAIGVWSHPLLDLLNTYGVRLLMPFSSRWFYGDALFIIDPWIWLTLGTGIVLSSWLARRQKNPGRSARPAQVALALSSCYALAMAALSRAGAAAVERQAGESASRTLAAPVFGNPLRRDVIRELHGRYELGELSFGWRPRYSATAQRPSGREEPAAALAARTRAGTIFLRWARFPCFELERSGEHVMVVISDLRYQGRGNRSWASVTVPVR